jgi:DNA ligase-1
MRLFTDLYFRLDATTRTSDKTKALETYFRAAPPRDAAWALFFLSGQRLKRAVSGALLREWTSAASGYPLWLIEESYSTVGDLAEALALLLPEPRATTDWPLHRLVEERIAPLAALTEVEKRPLVEKTWNVLEFRDRLVWHKLITGEFRVGVSTTLVVRALSAVAGVAPAVMAHRLMGWKTPEVASFARLMSDAGTLDPGQPFPFYLAYPLDPETVAAIPAGEPHELGAVSGWQIEWKWDGIRAQLIRRHGATVLWSRGEDLVTHRFPEVAASAAALPDGTVLDGELLVWDESGVRPFAHLQRRLGRKNVEKKMQADFPVVFLAYDLLEEAGVDRRPLSMTERRRRLESLFAARSPFPGGALRLSPLVETASWPAVAAAQASARDRHTEGLMLKRKDSPYGVGRQRGAWWKWKTAAYEVDAVLVYAQGGHGRRAGLFTDYTFALWDNGALVPVAKAYSGLTDAEIRHVDNFIRRNTVERHGPVRVVKPELVFQLAFEGIAESSRHKSGVAVRFPRMARWRHDKKAADADSLDTLKRLLPAAPEPAPDLTGAART